MIEVIYNKPQEAPPGLQAVFDCLNGNRDITFRAITVPGMENCYQQHFNTSDGTELLSITPKARVSVSWHRNTVDSSSPVVIETAEVIKDHYGNLVAIVTGWSMGSDGRTHAFATRPMSPRNPGGSTNYRQRNALTEEFVGVCKANIGKVLHLRQNGWGSSLPVSVGRTALQVTGLTCADLSDMDGNLLFNAADYSYEADPSNSEKPARRKRERTRTEARGFWPVLTDQKLGLLESAAKGEIPMADDSSDASMDAFLASVAS